MMLVFHKISEKVLELVTENLATGKFDGLLG